MFKATTPTISVEFENYDLTDIDDFRFIFAQNSQIIILKTLEEAVIKGNTLNITLTQEETLLFDEKLPILIQARLKIGSKVLPVISTYIDVKDMLDKEIM